MCILKTKAAVTRVEAYPAPMFRTQNVNIELYADVTTSLDTSGQESTFRPVGLLHEEQFTHDSWDYTWTLNSASVPPLSSLPSTIDCAVAAVPQVSAEAVQGSAYIRIEAGPSPGAGRRTTGTVSLKGASMTIRNCPVGSYLNGGACEACPAGKYYSDSSPCQDCPAGKWSSLTGASSAFDCFTASERHCRDQGLSKCPAGSVAVNGGRCGAYDGLGLGHSISPPSLHPDTEPARLTCVWCVRVCVPTGLDPSSDCIPCAAGKYIGRMKLPPASIWGDWSCQNIAGLDCTDPNNWYVLAARKQEYVCVCVRARTLAYDFTMRMQAVGAYWFWYCPAIAIGNRRWKSKSVRTARSDPLVNHQAARVAPAKLGGTRERSMKQDGYLGKTSAVHTGKHVKILRATAIVR